MVVGRTIESLTEVLHRESYLALEACSPSNMPKKKKKKVFSPNLVKVGSFHTINPDIDLAS